MFKLSLHKFTQVYAKFTQSLRINRKIVWGKLTVDKIVNLV